ncbi:MAG: malto-oligosyltrehalose synthase [Desulfobaccales bacterium]
MTSFKIPGATYRLQFNRTFKFSAAAALVPYLHELGITELYASPLLQARRGSLHGYSVTNPMELNPELGTRRAFDLLARKLKTRGMGLLFDIVPNHMALSHDNPWWMEVLENGPISPYAIFFDIDWHPPNRILEGRLLLPILGRPYGQALENQELKLTLESGGFFINYYEHKFPLDPKTYPQILAPGLAQLTQELGEESPVIIALTVIISLIASLPARTLLSPKKAKERQREKEIIKKNLWLLYQGTAETKKFLDETIRRFNGAKGEAETFDSLDRLLQHQPYRLAFWRVGLELINYRRFFSINDLIGIRIQDPRVFDAFKHGLLFKLVDEGKISGLRVDHIDGLYDPLEYLQRLQACFAPGDPGVPGSSQFYITVEKILAPGETLPPEWPVAGTTGYDFLNLVNGVFIEQEGLQELQKIYAGFLNDPINLIDLTLDKKKLVMNSFFGGEVESFVHYLSLLADQDWHARDISRGDLREALVEVMAALPIYRTYIRSLEVAPLDLAYLDKTCQEVRRRSPYLNQLALNFLERVLRLDVPAYLGSEQKAEWLNFVMRWQQFTGPIMAKGWEDTVLYIYNPLISLNEVGGCFSAIPAEDFHQLNQQRQESCPFTMNATSTHDTKRSEDVRARLNVLAEIPEDWEEHLKRWGDLNRSKKVAVNGVLAPDQNQEVLLYQTMLGAWPLDPAEVPAFKERLQRYMIKAAREAMVHTRWISPQVEHEKALLAFVDHILDEAENREFLADFRNLQARLAYYGAMNSLSQVLLKIAAPGVPDFYQGTELWDFSLVDPDNRRPVDFDKRVRFLKDLKLQERKKGSALVCKLISRWADGRIKLYITYKALNFRKDNPDLFLQGDYSPLAAEGDREKNILALARRQENNWALAVAARFLTKIVQPGQPAIGREVWGESVLRLPPNAPVRWIDILTGVEHRAIESGQSLTLPLQRIFRHLPVAFLSNSK